MTNHTTPTQPAFDECCPGSCKTKVCTVAGFVPVLLCEQHAARYVEAGEHVQRLTVRTDPRR